MRTSSIHGREGNNYRYLRAVKETEAIRERKASANIWDDIYKKSVALAIKDNKSDRK